MEDFTLLESAKADLEEKINRLQIDAFQKDKDLKLKTQEVEELKVEKDRLQRTMNDEMTQAKNMEAQKN